MSANAALGLALAGALLIYVECNRPGRVLPGATGLLLVLVAVSRLLALPVTRTAVALLVCGALGVLLLWWRRLFGLPGLLGTVALTLGLEDVAKSSAGRLAPWWALTAGLLLGGFSSVLMLFAGRARRAKRSHAGASAEDAMTGACEYWGVD